MRRCWYKEPRGALCGNMVKVSKTLQEDYPIKSNKAAGLRLHIKPYKVIYRCS